jgi:hypothetical protein
MVRAGTEGEQHRRPVQVRAATQQSCERHLRRFADERTQDRILIKRLEALLERQGRLLAACRQTLGEEMYKRLLMEHSL